ncbi:pleckstrin homology domain-containing family J member 1 isoform X1 [Rhinolophus sinicus]|uniref:pleckstrin homology domain-containing family J member 1 isoform X1 n=1 Tax=Rhinolophus sinicus TaxID=89399 RepID=UPI003D792BB0
MRYNEKELQALSRQPAELAAELGMRGPKKGSVVKRRLVKLVVNFLFYFRTDEAEPVGALLLEHCRITQEEPSGFSIRPPGAVRHIGGGPVPAEWLEGMSPRSGSSALLTSFERSPPTLPGIWVSSSLDLRSEVFWLQDFKGPRLLRVGRGCASGPARLVQHLWVPHAAAGERLCLAPQAHPSRAW